MAAPQQQDVSPEAIACGDSVVCNRTSAAVSVTNNGTGAAYYAEGYRTAIRAVGVPAVFGSSWGGAGVKGKSTQSNGVVGLSTYGTGVLGNGGYGTGVYGTSNDLNGIYGQSLTTGAADNGVMGYTQSTNSTAEAGVYGYNGGTGPGVYGVGIDTDTGYGVRGYSTTSNAVYGDSNSTDYGDAGGLFFGPHGVIANAEVAGTDGVQANCTTGGACYGVHAYSSSSNGVYASTGAAGGLYGFNTPNIVIAGGYTYYSGLSFLAQNGSDVALEVGDLAAASGMAAPLPDTDVPLVVVQRADAVTAAGIVGVVETAFQIDMVSKPQVNFNKTEIADGEGGEPDSVYLPEVIDRQVPVHKAVEGPVQPGQLMRIKVYGLAQVRADASAGAIAPGSMLTAGSAGLAVAAVPVAIEGQSVGYLPGTVIGKALEPLAEGQGLIWVLVDLQ